MDKAKIRRVLWTSSKDLQLLHEVYVDLELTKSLDRQRQLQELKIKMFYVGDTACLDRMIESSLAPPAMIQGAEQEVVAAGVTLDRLRFHGLEIEITRMHDHDPLARRKCIHCFNNVDAIMFTVPLSSYNEIVETGKTKKNRMQFELERFQLLTRHFPNTSVILLLTKREVFHRKLIDNNRIWEQAPAFADYSGPLYDNISGEKYFIQSFKNKLKENFKEACPGLLFLHATYDNEPKNMEFILDSLGIIVMEIGISQMRHSKRAGCMWLL